VNQALVRQIWRRADYRCEYCRIPHPHYRLPFQSGELVRLFHPRNDLWIEHFRLDGAWLIGLTPIGRATIHVLAMNGDDILLFRAELLREGIALA